MGQEVCHRGPRGGGATPTYRRPNDPNDALITKGTHKWGKIVFQKIWPINVAFHQPIFRHNVARVRELHLCFSPIVKVFINFGCFDNRCIAINQKIPPDVFLKQILRPIQYRLIPTTFLHYVETHQLHGVTA